MDTAREELQRKNRVVIGRLCKCGNCDCCVEAAQPQYIRYQDGIVVPIGDVPENLTLSQWLVERCNSAQLPAKILNGYLKVIGSLTYCPVINGYIYEDKP